MGYGTMADVYTEGQGRSATLPDGRVVPYVSILDATHAIAVPTEHGWRVVCWARSGEHAARLVSQTASAVACPVTQAGAVRTD